MVYTFFLWTSILSKYFLPADIWEFEMLQADATTDQILFE